jgi:hypothetical protein
MRSRDHGKKQPELYFLANLDISATITGARLRSDAFCSLS